MDKVVEAQKNDTTLEKYFALVVDNQGVEHDYFVQDGLLLRGWLPLAGTDVTGQVVQVVMPEKYCDLVLKATRGKTSGHFGVKKTYNHVLQHFYWPRIKHDVARFVKSCHVYQVAGKPNETIKPAP